MADTKDANTEQQPSSERGYQVIPIPLAPVDPDDPLVKTVLERWKEYQKKKK